MHKRATWMLRTFGLTKVPMILYTMPTVETLTEEKCLVCIPLNWRTRNHYGTMFFGALAVGADCACGLLAMHHVSLSKRRVGLLFKSFRVEFLHRPAGDVLFGCEQGAQIAAAVQQTIGTGERVNTALDIEAYLRSDPTEPVARFAMTLSLKVGL